MRDPDGPIQVPRFQRGSRELKRLAPVLSVSIERRQRTTAPMIRGTCPKRREFPNGRVAKVNEQRDEDDRKHDEENLRGAGMRLRPRRQLSQPSPDLLGHELCPGEPLLELGLGQDIAGDLSNLFWSGALNHAFTACLPMAWLNISRSNPSFLIRKS